VRSLLVILGVILVTYCGADLLLGNRYAGNLQMEQRFCRFRLCDGTEWSRIASKALWQTQPPVPAEAITDFRLLLQRDPNSPFSWVNLGDALAAAQSNQEAEYCFRQAVALAPHWPPILMRAVNFYFQSENPKAAFPLASQILDQVEQDDSDIFDYYSGQGKNVSDPLEYGFPRNPRPARAFLRYLIRKGNLGDSELTWRWMTAHGFADAQAVNDYVTFLLAKHRPQEASATWNDYLGPSAGDYGKSNYLFNGGFENESSGSPLDWKVQQTAGVEVSRDGTNPDSGQWSLRIRFDGKHNLTSSGVQETVILREGRYRFRARIRTEGLTTDQGILFELLPLPKASPVHWSSSTWLGTNPWSIVEMFFTVPRSGGAYLIQIARKASVKFDSLIAGTAWIDTLMIAPSQPQ
jgi:tetratricopeptide (TPR) repeat protein